MAAPAVKKMTPIQVEDYIESNRQPLVSLYSADHIVNVGDQIDARSVSGWWALGTVRKRTKTAIYVTFKEKTDLHSRWIHLDRVGPASQLAPPKSRSGGRTNPISTALVSNKIDVYHQELGWVSADIVRVMARQLIVCVVAYSNCEMWVHFDDEDEVAPLFTKTTSTPQLRFVSWCAEGSLPMAKRIWEKHEDEIDLDFQCDPDPSHSRLEINCSLAYLEQHTPVNAAVLSGNLDLVKWLIDDLSASLTCHMALHNPITLCAYAGHEHILRFFVSRGENIYHRCYSTAYPQCFASFIARERRRDDVYGILLQHHFALLSAWLPSGKISPRGLRKVLQFCRHGAGLKDLLHAAETSLGSDHPLIAVIRRRDAFERAFVALGEENPKPLQEALKEFPTLVNDRLDGNGETMLMRMCCVGGAEGVKMLLDMGADVNMTDHRGTTVLAFASVGGPKIMRIIEQYRPQDYAHQSLQGQCMLDHARECPEDRGDAFEFVAKKPVDWHKMYAPDGSNSLFWLARDGEWDRVELLLDHTKMNGNVSPHSKPWDNLPASPLAFAVVRQKRVIVEKLLRNGTDVNWRLSVANFTPLMFAGDIGVPPGNGNITKMLLAAGADPFLTVPNGATALDTALSDVCRINVARLIMKAVAEHEGEYTTPLMRASYRNDIDEVARLIDELDQDSDYSVRDLINAPSRVHCLSALHFAAAGNATEAAALLLENGADPAQVGLAHVCITPFLLACNFGSHGVVREILSRLTQDQTYELYSSFQRSRYGALVLAVISRSPETVEVLTSNVPACVDHISAANHGGDMVRQIKRSISFFDDDQLLLKLLQPFSKFPSVFVQLVAEYSVSRPGMHADLTGSPSSQLHEDPVVSDSSQFNPKRYKLVSDFMRELVWP